ncbi:hypothetical protein SAMN02746041_00607 [Desulfacinum hydrothermale DSM 13146]|uniref:Type IV pilus biogenesis n=1 Tax=Desulfacinum hydrothermale DSM 13146 TaxID=1121390 RepID=A0A1W1X5D4_9BACT|nr:hypothetical protein [Desulfacinum hydrothermale]SMC19050.1 hypothetical protein SAMN02746041_00607 [Desulfacinum hydrothermale DSM 13146]
MNAWILTHPGRFWLLVAALFVGTCGFLFWGHGPGSHESLSQRAPWQGTRGVVVRARDTHALWTKRQAALEELARRVPALSLSGNKGPQAPPLGQEVLQPPVDETPVVRERPPLLQGIVCRHEWGGGSPCIAVMGGKRVVEGDMIGSYRVADIQPHQVVLRDRQGNPVRLEPRRIPWVFVPSQTQDPTEAGDPGVGKEPLPSDAHLQEIQDAKRVQGGGSDNET